MTKTFCIEGPYYSTFLISPLQNQMCLKLISLMEEQQETFRDRDFEVTSHQGLPLENMDC